MGSASSKITFQQRVEEKCHQHDIWSSFVQTVHNENDWKLIAKVMFEDGIYHKGRLEVLNVFTRDVIQALKHRENTEEAEKIKVAYEQWQIYTAKSLILEEIDCAPCLHRERLLALQKENKDLRRNISESEYALMLCSVDKMKIKELEEEKMCLKRQLDAYMNPYMQHLSSLRNWALQNYDHCAREEEKTDEID